MALALAAVVVHEEAESPCDGSAAHCRMLVWKNHAPVRRAHSITSVADPEIIKGADFFFLLLSSKNLRGAQGGLHDFLGSTVLSPPLHRLVHVCFF